MATFSENQVRQLFVVKAGNSVSSKGGIQAAGADGTLYFKYHGEGGMLRTDIIDTKNIVNVSATSCKLFEHKINAKKITLDAEVNGGNVIAGQDYILNIMIRQYLCPDDGAVDIKHGAVHAYSGMTPSIFYKKMALSLAMNLSREIWPTLRVYLLHSTSQLVEVTAGTKDSTLSHSYEAVVLAEAEQDWHLGTMPQTFVDFEVYADEITSSDSQEVTWGKVENDFSNALLTPFINGKNVADMEYFYMGKRGDIYRNVGWPNVIETKYLVDPSKPYDFLDITYFYAGPNEDVQKSLKTITLACEAAGNAHTVIDAVISALSGHGVTVKLKKEASEEP